MRELGDGYVLAPTWLVVSIGATSGVANFMLGPTLATTIITSAVAGALIVAVNLLLNVGRADKKRTRTR